MQSDLDSMKVLFKNNIETLIKNGELDNAESLIKEYLDIFSDDVDVISMRAVIAIMKGKYIEAEYILKNELEKKPYDEHLLFNMSYLMNLNSNYKEGLEYFCKAKLFNPNTKVKITDIMTDSKKIDINNLRVLHGSIEIANQMCTITDGLKKIGTQAKTLNYYPNYLGYKSDYNFNINQISDINIANIETKKMVLRFIEENDVFHFHFGSSLTLDYSDLPLLKEIGKKVVMQHHGSDVRMHSKAIKLNKYTKVKDMDEESIKTRLDLLSKYIDNCIIGDYELYEYVKDYYSNINFIPIMIDVGKYRYIESKKEKKITIVHAPTSPVHKGTEYIIRAIDELKLKYDNIEFKLVQGLKHDEALKIYENSDLIIDQILIGSYGVFAIECMAMGKPVITFISDFMKDKYPKDLPIISANPDNLQSKLEYIIKNRDMLGLIGKKCRKYVEDYHDVNKLSVKVLELYKKL